MYRSPENILKAESAVAISVEEENEASAKIGATYRGKIGRAKAAEKRQAKVKRAERRAAMQNPGVSGFGWSLLLNFAVASLVLAWMYTVPQVTRDSPLVVMAFDVPLPRGTVSKLLVDDFANTGYWVSWSESITKVKGGFLVKAAPGDVVERWRKLGSFRFEETHTASQLFLNREQRGTATDIEAKPGLRYKCEWTLTAIGPRETRVERAVVAFEQYSMLNSFHRILPLMMGFEHAKLHEIFLDKAKK